MERIFKAIIERLEAREERFHRYLAGRLRKQLLNVASDVLTSRLADIVSRFRSLMDITQKRQAGTAQYERPPTVDTLRQLIQQAWNIAREHIGEDKIAQFQTTFNQVLGQLEQIRQGDFPPVQVLQQILQFLENLKGAVEAQKPKAAKKA